MTISCKYLIIGAGPTGLGAAYRLREFGESNFVVLERSAKLGGLATSYVDDKGFTWDVGGHVQFSHYRYFDDVMARAIPPADWLHHQRESWAWIADRFVPYPVQNNIRYLPKDMLWECLEGLVRSRAVAFSEKPADFGEWIRRTFGQGLAEAFMFPYNRKVWAFPLEELSYKWVGERVAVPDLTRILRNILFEQDDLSWGPNNLFHFPKHGGTGKIWDTVSDLIGRDHFHINQTALQIDPERREVRTREGMIYSYEYLLSTIPLDILCNSIESKIQNRFQIQIEKLRHSSSHIIGLGIHGIPGQVLRKKCWIYFSEADCPFYRVTVFSNYSPYNVPQDAQYWSLMTETSESQKKTVDRATLVEETIVGCLNTGLIDSRDQLASAWHFTADYGYPTPSLLRDEALDALFRDLREIGIASRGRFGAWKYEVSNQDHSFMQGVEWVNHVKFDIPETTVFFPDAANANWGR